MKKGKRAASPIRSPERMKNQPALHDIASRSLTWLRSTARPAGGLLLAALTALFAFVFAGAEHEALAIAEGRFLALEIGIALAAIGWLACRTLLAQWIGGATLLAFVALPASPTRSAVVGGILLFGILLAAAPLALRRRDHGFGATLADFFFLTLGLQVLARPDLLLQPFSLRSAALVLMPLLAAFALEVLADRHGNERALLALAVVALLAPGLNVHATLLLLAAAAGTWAGDGKNDLLSRGAVAAFLVLPLLLRWPTGLLASALGATLLVEALAPRRTALPAFLATVVASMAIGRPAGEPLDAFLLAAALTPAAFAVASEVRQRVAAGVFLILGAAWLAKDLEGWAAGALLLALSVPVERPAGRLQRGFTLVLLAGGLGLASFPWLRPEPLEGIWRLLTPSPITFFSLACGLVLVPGLLAERLPDALQRRLPANWPLVAAGLGIAITLLTAMPPAGLSLLRSGPQALVEARPSLRLDIGTFPCRQVIVDSQLFHGAELAPGQEVARLIFLGKNDEELLVLPLRAGDDTADWAAAREDLERRPDFRAPRPWLSQVAPTGTFFSGRFRRRFDLPTTIDAVAVELRRADGLPGPLQVALHELELRP